MGMGHETIFTKTGGGLDLAQGHNLFTSPVENTTL